MSDNTRRKLFKPVLMVLPVVLFVLSAPAQNMFRKITDFDGDGKTDYAVTRSENGLKVWYVWQSTAGFKTFQWGLANDSTVAGDYDGDGKTDFAVLRTGFSPPANNLHTFYTFQSLTNSFVYKSLTTFLATGYLHLPQDYDGDGKTDPAMLVTEGTGGTLTFQQSSTGSNRSTTIPFGDFAARTGDMDGDGRADRVSYTPIGNVVHITNIETNVTRTVQIGTTNDLYYPADFDADGIGDLTVWRRSEGNWYWLKSSDGTFQSAHWGATGDIPVAGDYDGDGKTDLAIWRAGSPQSYYWVNGSQNGVSIFAWGLSTDTVVGY